MSEQQLREGANSITALVDYQDGAVVSRTLVKKDKGTITVFAFDQDQALSEHSVPHDALVQIIDGEAEITVGGTPYAVSAGEMIMMPGNVPHAVKATARFKMILTMLRE
jgi:quercetin dioxygenase-like cupin family protein